MKKNNRFIKRFLPVLTLCGLLSACEFLETEPHDTFTPQGFYKTEEQVNTALYGVYRALANNMLYGANMQGIMGLSADLGYESYNRDQFTVGYNYVVSTDSRILSYWQYLYICISRANLLLENLDRAPMDETVRDNVRGEALFLRAYAYFMLVNKFRNVPLILHSAPSAEPEYTQVPQADPEKVYEQIVSDMETAAGLVKPASEVECGNYRDMDLPAAKAEAAAMLPVLESLTAEDLHY